MPVGLNRRHAAGARSYDRGRFYEFVDSANKFVRGDAIADIIIVFINIIGALL